MANMGYCRFRNTVGDLDDCLDHLDDKLSSDESKARRRLIVVAYNIVQNFLDDEGNLDSRLIDDLQSEDD